MLPPLTLVTVRVNDAVSEPETTVQSTVLPGLPSRFPVHSAESGRRPDCCSNSSSSELATSSLVSTGTTSKFIIRPSTLLTSTVRHSFSPFESTSQCAVEPTLPSKPDSHDTDVTGACDASATSRETAFSSCSLDN